MERSKKTKKREDGKVLFVKLGGGAMDLGGKRNIKPGQRFWAHPDEIPQSFRDLIVPVDDEVAGFKGKDGKVKKEQLTPVTPETFTYKPVHKGGGRYNVEREDGKVINDVYLSKDQAANLVEDLTENTDKNKGV